MMKTKKPPEECYMPAMTRTALRVSPRSRELVFEVVRPLVRILRACGVPERTIRATVDSACHQYARNFNRAVRLDHVPFAKLAEIVMVWARDPEFIEETGLPMKLQMTGSPRSFESLLKKVGVATQTSSVLDQLEMLGSVQRCGKRVRLVSNVLLSVTGKQFVAGPLLNSIREFLETIEYNLHQRPGSVEGRMHRLASCASLDPSQFAEVQRFVRVGGQAFLEALDEKLDSCKSKGGTGLYYGAGIYVVVQRPDMLRKQRQPTRRSARARPEQTKRQRNRVVREPVLVD